MVAVADFEIEAVFAGGQAAAAADALPGGDAVAGGSADLRQAGIDAEVAVAVVDDDGIAVTLQGCGVDDFSRSDVVHGGGGCATSGAGWDVERLIADGAIEAFPIVYEDFLPVSAAGIFQSNLGGTEQKHYQANAAQQVFEEALQARVQDEIALYAKAEADSLEALQQQFGQHAA